MYVEREKEMKEREREREREGVNSVWLPSVSRLCKRKNKFNIYLYMLYIYINKFNIHLYMLYHQY